MIISVVVSLLKIICLLSMPWIKYSEKNFYYIHPYIYLFMHTMQKQIYLYYIFHIKVHSNIAAAAAAAKSLQSCPTLCNPMDCSLPGFSVHGILQARTLEWVAISFSNAGKWKVKVKSLSRVWLLATPWTAAYQAPPSMGFSGQQYWSGVPLPSPTFKYYLSN